MEMMVGDYQEPEHTMGCCEHMEEGGEGRGKEWCWSPNIVIKSVC